MSVFSVKKLECPHKENHSRKLTQTQDNIKYDIISCDICAGIALKSDGEFVEVSGLIDDDRLKK